MTILLTPPRRSPVHDAIEAGHRPAWRDLARMPVALHLGDPDAEPPAARRLALCDMSALPRVTLKGPAALALLGEQGIGVPDAVLGAAPLGGRGVVARTGSAEFFIEDGPRGDHVARVRTLTGAFGHDRPGVHPAARADASLFLSGANAGDVLEQTCGYNFRHRDPATLVFTRVAGVSCSILPRTLNAIDLFQLWADGTYGQYLWETLLDILSESGGRAVGALCYFPELSHDDGGPGHRRGSAGLAGEPPPGPP